jgi:hypothetical protein
MEFTGSRWKLQFLIDLVIDYIQTPSKKSSKAKPDW